MTTASPDASSDTGTVLARSHGAVTVLTLSYACLLYTSPSPRD